MNTAIAIETQKTMLDWRGRRAALLQTGLATVAIILPSLCHLWNAPVKVFLPIHWPVLLAGLVYGWRSGLIIGLLSPLVSFAISGMPGIASLPAMCLEIGAYGFAAGFAKENLKLNDYAALLGAIVAGRIVYALAIISLFHAPLSYAIAALIPGLFAAVAQIALLPTLSKRWTKNKSA
ncbi:MAG TPA: ECF transporter S component [Elusimicrobiales bacterium]|nr:ECF transporter S component [Elusimicrobiales bacterium]